MTDGIKLKVTVEGVDEAIEKLEKIKALLQEAEIKVSASEEPKMSTEDMARAEREASKCVIFDAYGNIQ